MELIIILVVIGVLALIFIGMYNGLVRARNETKNAWSQIDVQLKRRHDLIPNLVETVKGYANFERSALEAVIKARSQAVSVAGQGPDAQGKAENQLSGALGRLFALAESYPQLKANTNFLALQEELTSTENKISFSRQYYNDSVLRYNNQLQSFPSNIMAGIGGFKSVEYFEVTAAEEREVPTVKF
jgi:LemA protein